MVDGYNIFEIQHMRPAMSKNELPTVRTITKNMFYRLIAITSISTFRVPLKAYCKYLIFQFAMSYKGAYHQPQILNTTIACSSFQQGKELQLCFQTEGTPLQNFIWFCSSVKLTRLLEALEPKVLMSSFRNTTMTCDPAVQLRKVISSGTTECLHSYFIVTINHKVLTILDSRSNNVHTPDNGCYLCQRAQWCNSSLSLRLNSEENMLKPYESDFLLGLLVKLVDIFTDVSI